MLKPGVEHGKVMVTVSCYMVQKCAVHTMTAKGGRGIDPLILKLGTRWG